MPRLHPGVLHLKLCGHPKSGEKNMGPWNGPLILAQYIVLIYHMYSIRIWNESCGVNEGNLPIWSKTNTGLIHSNSPFLWANISLFHSPLALSLVLLKSFGFCSLFPPLQEALRLNCTNSDSDAEIFSSIALAFGLGKTFCDAGTGTACFPTGITTKGFVLPSTKPPPLWAVALPVPSALADLGGTVLATLFLASLPS